MNHNYPIMLNIKGKNCLVVGGGTVAHRKIKTLLSHLARVTVISEDLTEELKKVFDNGEIDWIQKKYESGDIKDAALVFAATDSREVNLIVAQEAQEAGILINIADCPELCDFIVPSKVEQGDLTIAISTNGKSPALAKKIREQLDKQFGPHYAKFLEIMGDLREKITEKIPEINLREKLYRDLVNSDIIKLLEDADETGAQERVNELFKQTQADSRDKGE